MLNNAAALAQALSHPAAGKNLSVDDPKQAAGALSHPTPLQTAG